MRIFYLVRETDVTGVSGTGVVAEGVEFSDGRAALRWCVGDHKSTVIWDSVESLVQIHGHGGATKLSYMAGDGSVYTWPNVPPKV